ncbi:MAG: hypothetical protein HGA44_09025 [Cellulomonadaceae bacterium]|nr:hypothetical protein [Cellulomonadaceae bacterium]
MGDRCARSTYSSARIGRLNLTHAQLTDVDLRGADLSGLDGVAGLAGATISESQLVDLAGALAVQRRIAVA